MMNKVQALKTRFEKLNSEVVESLDITPISVRREPAIKFTRSATCIDFRNFKVEENSKQSTKTIQPKFQFQRQSSNSSNSSNKSIRRSPAFRFDAQARPSVVKSLTKEDSVKKKIECEELEYLSTSATIKKALLKPLPTGSPPKKPPRVFQLTALERKKDIVKISPNTIPKKTSKNEEKKAISSFLSCIVSPCTIDPIYYEQIKKEQKEETIYMEPYAHLKQDFSPNNGTQAKAPEELHYMCTVLDSSSSDMNGNDTKEEQRRRRSLESSDIEDYEKINLLFNVVYDEKHRDNIIDETSHSSNESTKSPTHRGVSRTLTEKRKNYVRRMTQISINANVNDKIPMTYGSLKQLPSAASKISQFQSIIDSNKVKESKSDERSKMNDKLFDMALLVGFDVTKMSAYIKTVFPRAAKPPPMIEQFIYPTDKTPSDLMTKDNQNFSLILTNEYGEHLYGYCRQVVPEGFEICLPLTYCIISSVKATGFYFNVLKEIEARHGQPDTQFTFLLRQLQNQTIPKSGKYLHTKLMESPMAKKLPEIPKKPDRETIQKSQTRFNKRLSLESPEWLKMENSSEISKNSIDLGLINRSLLDGGKRIDEILIRRPNDLRLENRELSVLYESTTSELLVVIFGSLLIERKVILIGRNLSKVSSCVMALYSILYPFQWQHTIITITPDNLSELIQAPFPVLAGILKDSVNVTSLDIEDGIVVDLETKSLLRKCGDDTTLVPETLKKSLMLSLKIVDALDRGKNLSNVLIAEAFLQFFVKIFSNLSTKNYIKETFIESHSDQAVKFFLDWFLETIMFKEFFRKKTEHDKQRDEGATASNYFDLFNTKVLEKSATISNQQQRKNVELLMKNSRQLNKRRNFKDRIKDFLTSS
ncbi:CLUMA_CG008166, isoform A [Clunio marinus]|uniref:CLUMA_CG008166, isoform A n=1 Tax=Clunio marinus TaxID=568069 RepID=A0A1J1I4H9_9DIPT|nr:CLUMA_CG008166, isoform A [Clunio marinus]